MQSLEDFNAINVLIGVACFFFFYHCKHIRAPDSLWPSSGVSTLQPTALISPRSTVLPQSCTKCQIHNFHSGIPSVQNVIKNKTKHYSVLCNPSQALRSHLQAQRGAKKITLSNQPSICQKYHYRVISNRSAARIYLFPQ